MKPKRSVTVERLARLERVHSDNQVIKVTMPIRRIASFYEVVASDSESESAGSLNE
jgi:hypothetical protein